MSFSSASEPLETALRFFLPLSPPKSLSDSEPLRDLCECGVPERLREPERDLDLDREREADRDFEDKLRERDFLGDAGLEPTALADRLRDCLSSI